MFSFQGTYHELLTRWWAKVDSIFMSIILRFAPFNRSAKVLTPLCPALSRLVGQSGLEPPTSRLSVVCSSQLSYWPILYSASMNISNVYVGGD